MKRRSEDDRAAKRRQDAAATKTRLAARAGATVPAPLPSLQGHGGLAVELHPLLRSNVALSAGPTKNPLKPARRQFDPASVNPYLTQTAIARPRPAKPLHFAPRGTYIRQADELRDALTRRQQERQETQRQRQSGEAPDETLGEQNYIVREPPLVEWWDQPYLKERQYNDNLVLDSDEAPVSAYIQHPRLLTPAWQKHQPAPKPMHLTKRELKRIRRNERLERHKDKQDRIKLGLDPPPPPKVKLSNLMNVLTNEAIQDPTALELRVKREVQERLDAHMRVNEARKLTSDERAAKAHAHNLHDLERGYHTAVFRIDSLANPKSFFKVDINAKQLELVGMCLLNPRFNLVVVEGGSKNIGFYKKLLTRRIDWTEFVPPRDAPEREPVDLSKNECRLVWEGQLKELNFKKWSVMKTQDDDEALQLLNRFNVENYWREACAG